MLDYVHWEDFAHSPERNWADVERQGWVARRTSLTKAEGIKRFGLRNSARFPCRPLRARPRHFPRKSGTEAKTNTPRSGKYGTRPAKKRIFVAKGADDVLESKDPQYELEKFFPCPRPAYATLTNEDLIPIPDYLAVP